MNIPVLGPEPTSHNRKKEILRNKVFWYLVFTVMITITLGWLVIQKFLKDPLVEIEHYIETKKISKAAVLNYKLLQKKPEHRLALLMNGSIINFGIREMNINNIHLPFFEYDDFLLKEDKTGVFIRQGFLRKFSVFPDSQYFLDEFCNFSMQYPESLRNPETQVIINRAFHSKTQWNKVSDSCISHIFHKMENIHAVFAKVEGDNLSVREKPSTKAKRLDKLKRHEIVLIKYQGDEETIGSKKAKWNYILNENQVYGWVYGGYLQLQE